MFALRLSSLSVSLRKTMLNRTLRLAAFALTLAATAAHADVTFTFTPTDGVGGIYSFTEPKSLVTGGTAGQGYFAVSPTGEGGFLAGSDTVFFITAGNSQGYAGTIQLINSDFTTQVFFDGPQLFTGTEDAPTFKIGTFLLTNLTVPSPTNNPDGTTTVYPVPDGDQLGQSYNLVISDSSIAATPEPSSLVLLGTGALGLAGAARRRFLTRG